MAIKKKALDLVAEILGELRDNPEIETRNFVYYWVENTIHVIVEEDNNTVDYIITSAVEFVRDIQDSDQIGVEEITLSGYYSYDVRRRIPQYHAPNTCIGGGSLDWEIYEEDKFTPRASITNGLKRIICKD